jgi:DNA-binding protein YbaB
VSSIIKTESSDCPLETPPCTGGVAIAVEDWSLMIWSKSHIGEKFNSKVFSKNNERMKVSLHPRYDNIFQKYLQKNKIHLYLPGNFQFYSRILLRLWILKLKFFHMDYNKAKELLKLQQEAQKIKNELSNIHIEAEVDGVVITVDGEMKVINTKIENLEILKDVEKLEKALTAAANKGIKKSQEIAAEKMKGIMG